MIFRKKFKTIKDCEKFWPNFSAKNCKEYNIFWQNFLAKFFGKNILTNAICKPIFAYIWIQLF
jgi:hypothetical protein